ncbi:unnamed protein product, partial [Ectocarpus sp. 8 AP-2014]
SVRRSERPGPSLCSERGRSCSKVAECTCLLKAKQTTSSEQQCVQKISLCQIVTTTDSHSPVFKDRLHANQPFSRVSSCPCHVPSLPLPLLFAQLDDGRSTYHSISEFPHRHSYLRTVLAFFSDSHSYK